MKPFLNTHTTSDESHSEAISVLLEAARRKQEETSIWSSAGPGDAGRHHATLVKIKKMLIEALAMQRLERDNLAQTYRSVSNCVHRCLLRSQLVFLVSKQRNLVEILQKQVHLVELHVASKAKCCHHPPDNHSRTVKRVQQPVRVSAPAFSRAREEQESQTEKSHSPQTTELKLVPPNSSQDVQLPFMWLSKEASSCQSSPAGPGNTLQQTSFQRGNKSLIQRRTEDDSRHLSKLIHGGLTPNESALEPLLKVTSRGRPPSSYPLKSQTERNLAQMCRRDQPHRYMAGVSKNALDTEASVTRPVGIKMIHLVDNDELMPNALMDFYWDQSLKMDSEDWGEPC